MKARGTIEIDHLEKLNAVLRVFSRALRCRKRRVNESSKEKLASLKAFNEDQFNLGFCNLN